MGMPAPPRSWATDVSGDDAQKVVERKTFVMRLQNRLQQLFARYIRQGDPVLIWDYEMNTRGGQCGPPLYRATVRVPLINRMFTGAWAQGQRDAQLDTCQQVCQLLDNGELSEMVAQLHPIKSESST